jgi:hypothetical protein
MWRVRFSLLLVTVAMSLTGVLAPVALGGPAGVPLQVMDFAALMTGDQEVPPNDSGGFGIAFFETNADQTEMVYFVGAANIMNVTAAHIHVGQPGENGPVVLSLFNGPATSFTDFDLLSFNGATAADLVGPMAGHPLSDLVAEMAAGNTYTNAHTTARPGGEIRGQNSQFTPDAAPGLTNLIQGVAAKHKLPMAPRAVGR